jgi:hypothetical protein
MEVDVNVDVPETEGVTEQEARMELDRLLPDPQFHSTERNRNFLRFVAQEMFEGRDAAVKAYTIAVDVFGRPSSFDPTTDPIVRIEATRLRASLAQYYESRAEEGTVRIELPRGRYIPVFTKAPPQGDSLDDADAADEPTLKGASSGWPIAISKRRLILSTIAVSAAAGLIWLSSARAPVFSDKPSVAVEMKLAGDKTDVEAGFIRDYLMIALSQFQTLKLAAGETPTIAAADATQSAAGLSLFKSAHRTTSPYQVILKYHPAEADRAVWWQIINPVTGEALRSGVERVFLDHRSEADVRRELVTSLATRFAGTRGVINSIELARELAAPTLGNGCILRSAVAVERLDAGEMWEARTCLEATLLAMPNDPDVNAELAIALLAAEPPEEPTESASRALMLANKAVSLAPMSDRASYAQMLALFRNGQTEAAFVSGYRAIALNPNNSLIPAQLGAMLFASGRWAEGAGLAIKAGMIENVPNKEAGLTLALDAYRRGEFAEALLRVQQMGRSGNYVANILQLAASGQLDNVAAAKEAANRLKTRGAHFWTSFHSDMTARHYSPGLIDQLGSGLIKAGLALPTPMADASPN